MRWGVASAAALIAMGAASARAQPLDPDVLDQRGIALRRQRRDAEALEEFRRSYALRAAPRTLAQIGLAEQALGRWVEAEADVRAALKASGDPWIERNRAVLVAGLIDIERHLGAIEVEANVPGAELWVNGSRAAKLPLAGPLRVEAGSIVIEVRADGFAPARRITSVEPGESARESVHLVPLVPLIPKVDALPSRPAPVETTAGAPAPSGEHPAHTHGPLRAASFVAMGAGVAGIALGSYFGARTLSEKSARDAVCPSSVCLQARGVALDRSTRWDAVQATAWFAFGIAAAGAGVTLFWLSRPTPATGRPPALHLALDVSPVGGSALLGGSW